MAMRCDCLARPATPLEANVREAVALLDAITVGGMLTRPRSGSASESKHVAAEALLEVVRKRLSDGLTMARHMPR